MTELELQKNQIKCSNRPIRGISSKRVTSCRAQLRCVAPGQHNSEETSQQWRVVGDTVSHLTQTSGTDSDVLTTELTGQLNLHSQNRNEKLQLEYC